MNRFADDPILRAAYEYWCALPRAGRIPDRRSIDPVEMPPIIFSNVVLLDLIDDGRDVRVRLAGDEVVRNFGFDVRGKTLSEFTDGDYREYMLRHIDLCRENLGPVYSESSFRWHKGGTLRTRRLVMPLSNGQPEEMAMILAVQTFPVESMLGKPFHEIVADSAPVDSLAPKTVKLE